MGRFHDQRPVRGRLGPGITGARAVAGLPSVENNSHLHCDECGRACPEYTASWYAVLEDLPCLPCQGRGGDVVAATCQLCGQRYTLMEYRAALRFIGYMPDPPVRLELRECCGSTMGILVDDEGVWIGTQHPDERA